MGTSQQFSLRWNNYLRHITCAFDSLRSDEDLVDVTLSCEGKRIRAHKMLLSACSTYFRDLFKENPCQHPVIIFRNVKFEDLAALIDFMYQGEVNVVQDQLASFLTTAELLAVQGLSDGNGKDQDSEQPKEVELPDSPMLPPEPEVQLSNNTHGQKQLSSSSVSGSVSSPVSFFPVDQRADSPPSNKRRKWGSSVGGSAKSGNNSAVPTSGSVEKDGERERETERRRGSAAPATSTAQSVGRSSPDPIEIIPVVPNLKLEMPDYLEQEQDASSCSYSDSNQGGGGGQGSSRDPLPPMSQLLAHGGASTSTDGKQEPTEMYSTNSGDSSLPPSAESLSASDISQILAKPGPSGENQSQDSLQGDGGSDGSARSTQMPSSRWPTTATRTAQAAGGGAKPYSCDLPHWLREGDWMAEMSSPSGGHEEAELRLPFVCQVCGKAFKHAGSLSMHRRLHRGHTQCPVCHKVFSRTYYMKVHMQLIHHVNVDC